MRNFFKRACRFAHAVHTVEVLALCTVFLPSFFAGIGFFFGKTVSPWYFHGVIAVLTCVSFGLDKRKALRYLLLLAVCAVLTAYTFPCITYDAQNYHFPVQRLLREGWNPIFDSTLEKFAALAGDAEFSHYHALFLPKFCALCGALTASGLGLFTGDAFLDLVLAACLFSTARRFAKRQWTANAFWRLTFAAALVFSPIIWAALSGQADYATYASFGIAALTLVLHAQDGRAVDLAVFALAACICMATKTTGTLSCSILVALTLPLWHRRIGVWRILPVIVLAVSLVNASPFLTNWIHYGSPLYPFSTFNPAVKTFDITSDFTGNADALSMGYFARICYAWISPQVTTWFLRTFGGNPNFNPVFTVYAGVGGMGPFFGVLLVTSSILLVLSRKNAIAWLCAVIFISANFAPLQYIGYNRYFMQIWMIFPVAVLHFIHTTDGKWAGRSARTAQRVTITLLTVLLIGLTGLGTVRFLAQEVHRLTRERLRQDLIAGFPQDKPVYVNKASYRFASVARFKQAGRQLALTKDGHVDTILDKNTGMPCLGEQAEKNAALFEKLPHVLWER